MKILGKRLQCDVNEIRPGLPVRFAAGEVEKPKSIAAGKRKKRTRSDGYLTTTR